MNYPVRINKYLALKNISTRRGADDLIKKGCVFINGKKATLGAKVEESDIVEVKNKTEKKYSYIAYYKPKGVITHSPQNEEVDIKEKIKASPLPKDIFPIGRLDKSSHGLILLTNDGRITDKLLNPKYFHNKEYIVKTNETLKNNFKDRMERGVNIEGYITQKSNVRILNENTFTIELSEGKKHQIRRMCAALGVTIVDLKRVRILNIILGKMKPNEYREIKGKELSDFLSAVLAETPSVS